MTEQADQPSTTDAETASAEQAAADPAAASSEAAGVPAATEAPEVAPDTTAGVATEGAEPDDEAAGHTTEQEEPDDEAAGHTTEQAKPDDEAAGHTTEQAKPDDEAAGHTTEQAKPDDEAAGHTTEQAKPDDEAAGHTTEQAKPDDEAAGHTTEQANPDDEAAGHTTEGAELAAVAAAAPKPSGAGTAPPADTADGRSPGIGTPIPVAATTGGLNSGDIVSGVVSSIDRRELELDLGSGRTGVIGSRHWAMGLDVDLTAEAKVGDIVEAAVLVREDHKQRIVLSRSWGRQQRAWELAENARKTGEIISGVVTDAVKAGLTVDIGVRAFVPASMAGDEDLESLVGTTVECKVTEVNQLKGRCILSRKAALRTRERQVARKRLADLSPGTLVRARVTKVEDFGALVIAEGDLRGRIRRSDLSWFRVRRPSDVVSVGDEVEARVVGTTPAKMSVDLSLRIGDDPMTRINPGERHLATVTGLAPFGAFVTVDDGIEGLVPTAELAEHPIRHPREVVVPGDSVLAEVTKVDRQRRDLEFSVNLGVLVRPPGEA